MSVRAYLAPLVANAAHEVHTLAAAAVALSDEARAGLADALAQRLEIAAAPSVQALIGQGRLAVDGADLARGWGVIFAAYPDLEPLVERMIGEWREGIARLLRRYAEDAALLGEARAELTRVAVVGGAWKKSPTLRLTTGGGREWFYKDHTLAIGAWLMELIRRLNDSGLPLPLHVRAIEACPGYGWDEAVTGAPCADEAQAERYFVRIGMWLRLMQALGANDLHAKNLIAVGEHPVPIDHENLMQPARTDARTAMGSARRARQRSPLESGLLPHLLVGEPGRRAVNAGGLEVGGDYLLPFRTPDGYPELSLPCTLPRLGDRIVRAREGVAAILSGFDAMHGVLAGPGAAVLHAMLPRAASVEVRVLRRPAHVTRRLIVDSLQPDVLARPGARRAMLAARGEPSDLQALIEVEVPRHYELAALDFVRPGRSDAEHAADREVVATAIACAPAESTSIEPDLHVVPGDGQLEHLRAATAIGDLLLAEAHGDASAMHWLGVSWHPLGAARLIEVLPNDLLSGNAGLAVALAALFKVTREARFGDAARRALSPVTRSLAANTASHAWRPWGAYLGSAGRIYAQQRVATLLGDARRMPSDAELAALLRSDSGGIDLATGTAGLVAVAAQVLSPLPAWLGALGDVLASAQRLGLPPLPYPDAALPAYLPDAAGGVAFALRRLASRTGRARFAVAAPAREPRTWDVADADTVLRRHAATGRWSPDAALADRLNLGGMLGIGAVALSLLREYAPEAGIPSLWQLD